MTISFKKAAGFGLALFLGAGVALSTAAVANAAEVWTPEGTPQPYFIYSLDTNERVADGTKLTYDGGYFASPDPANPDALFADAPEGADAVKIFISPRGQESDMTKWSSSYAISFNPGTRSISAANPSLSQFPASSFGAVKAAGGNYSVGFAFTANNGVTFKGLGSFTHIAITAGTADWTFVTPTKLDDGGHSTDPTGQIAIEAPVAAPVDGALSLSIPTGEKATLGSAALDNTGKSVSSGTLPTFQVSDERYVTKPGWTVNTSVASFTSGSNTIDPTALAIVPAVKSTSTATGVSAVSALTGAKEAAKFAEAAAGQGTGRTDLSAALTLTAPLGTPAGTYTSTMTVTVVSK